MSDNDLTLLSEVIHVRNIHCSSCARAISSILASLSPPPVSVDTSIKERKVTVTHSEDLTRNAICSALKHGGFEPVPEVAEGVSDLDEPVHDSNLWNAGFTSKPFPFNVAANWYRRRNHRKFCEACNTEHDIRRHKKSSTSFDSGQTAVLQSVLVSEKQDDTPTEYRALFSVGGMSCASCSNAITSAVKEIPGVVDMSVDLLGNSAIAILMRRDLADDVKEAVEDIGYECEIIEVVPVSKPSSDEHTWKVTASIGGMTCAACVAALTDAFKSMDFVRETNITLLTNSGTFIVTDPSKKDAIRDTIEDIGYECGDISIEEDRSIAIKQQSRTIMIQVDGMFCDQCPRQINEVLASYGDSIELHSGPVTQRNNIIRITYVPSIPTVTLRKIVADMSALSPQFKFTIVHPPTLEERAQQIALRERRRLVYRMILSISVAIPTFIIGIVMMMILPESNHYRQWAMEPIWAGNVGRAVWAMFFMASVVYFFAADIFHVKAIKEVRSLWRAGVPLKRRFFRFGSMNLLMSLGTSIAYFASIVLLGLEASANSMHDMTSYSTTYFDSVVFLTMFLLVGRLLEAYSKSKTASAISLLTSLRPRKALLVDDADGTAEEIGIDFLETGDMVKILSGMSPPADGTIVSGVAEFNEAALTGEALPVEKVTGSQIFAGTTHTGGSPIIMRVESGEGSSMLDQITNVVRQGQSKRAPIERVADVLTGYFVPIVTLIAVSVFVVWLGLGYGGALPADYLDIDIGGWTIWSLEFAISVFVVACPCGIGLAAPTAMFVGTGIAAKHGILPQGGGEAFQEGSHIDVVVFDKTGTLTEGGAPKITDTWMKTNELANVAIQIARDLELNSTHPLARALVDYAEKENEIVSSDDEAEDDDDTSKNASSEDSSDEKKEIRRPSGATSQYRVRLGNVKVADISEVAGRGLKGHVRNDSTIADNDKDIIEAVIGNEKWMEEHGATLNKSEIDTMHKWKQQGKSVILLAVRRCEDPADKFTIISLFAAADPLRKEASFVVGELQRRKVQTWMISGDNEITAKAVAKQVGIPPEHVVAGVLPHEKAEKITWLQQTASMNNAEQGKKRWLSLDFSGRDKSARAIVAMVGDGINDAPSLAAADVGIAIGSGSDIALSSAKFVLMSSNLTQILTLIDISRIVFRRVQFNFLWAGIYNLIGVPIAAGVIYPANHARLAPAWASLAMALSSVSVVCSSLALKLYRPKKYVY
ncbi:uncharacterized protein V1518DRAFT_413089 [Limtongia smithiae]|uniref:uncharacterized protein n=1 Tax=Limtongia smithiae TaxID=1125753 RepID=UPI0034CDBA49